MTNREAFRTWLDQAIAEAPRTEGGIPLLGADRTTPPDATALIHALADLIIATCVRPIEQQLRVA
jgi:hypothetical protein